MDSIYERKRVEEREGQGGLFFLILLILFSPLFRVGCWHER